MGKMIIMDLDGTLLKDDKNISSYTLSILEKCKNIGIKIGIATARSEKSAKRCIETIEPDIMILNGGALIINNNKEIIYKKLLSARTSDAIINECVKNKNTGNLTVETEGNYYASYKEPAYHSDYMYGVYYDFTKPLSKETYKISVEIFDKNTALSIENKFKECRAISFTGENWYRFAHKEADKMAAIKEIVKNEGINISDIIAFGDDYNDIEMIKNCGTGVAMENGIEEIKNAAKYICKNNNEDGVGKWIEENIFSNK
jgi:Cof subfamily protein (haloacid dehalogenase superfamily)